MNSKRFIDAVCQIPMQFALLCLSGLISIFAMILPGYVSKLIQFATRGLDAPVGVANVIIAVIGIVTCVIAEYIFMKSCGTNAAIFAKANTPDNVKLNILFPILITAISFACYTLISAAVSFDYIGGPVTYLAPYLSKADASAKFNTVLTSDKWISFIFLAVFEIPAMIVGYIAGYKKRLKDQNPV